jgi:hypothetical protein
MTASSLIFWDALAVVHPPHTKPMATTMHAPEINPHTPYLTFTSVSGETVILDSFLSAAIGRWVRHQIATIGSQAFQLKKPQAGFVFQIRSRFYT